MKRQLSALRAQAGGNRDLRVRLASSDHDIAAAQALRFDIFSNEMGAQLDARTRATARDVDDYDAVCDHLLVEDHASGSPVVVGTYRLLRQSVATPRGGFYTATEFDLSPLIGHSLAYDSNLLELGRSCVARAYRDSGTIQILWRGIADYLAEHDIGYLFGCASFFGTDPDTHAAALTYLHHHHLAPPELRARARGEGRVDLDRLPLSSYDKRLAMRALPPLIKAYLRVGASIGDGGWIDRNFNTIDVFMVMPVSAIAARYADRFVARNAA
jgi:L-ornithine Nalpha-acyltransferase